MLLFPLPQGKSNSAPNICIIDFRTSLVSNSVESVPIYEMWHQATRSIAATTVFIVLLIFAATFALIGAQQTGSRLTWSFARDHALIGSSWLGVKHPTLEVPMWSLIFNFAIMFIIGCIYLGSSSAFNAFIGTGLVLQHVSYAFPAILLIYRKRSDIWLPTSAPFKLPGFLGWVVNIITVCFAVLVLIFYDFPTVMPVTGSNMSEYPRFILYNNIMLMCLISRLYCCCPCSNGYLCGFELGGVCTEGVQRATPSTDSGKGRR